MELSFDTGSSSLSQSDLNLKMNNYYYCIRKFWAGNGTTFFSLWFYNGGFCDRLLIISKLNCAACEQLELFDYTATVSNFLDN